MRTLRWGIIGTGAIAHAFADGLKQSRSGKLVAVGSRRVGTSRAFAKEYGLANAHGRYEALLADKSVQAVYISTPHPFHAEWAIKAAEAGKHVLCEKPLALNRWQAEAMFMAARKGKVFMAEAFMYRCHPQVARVVELIRDGAIGEVRMIRAAFGFGGGNQFNPESRLFKNSLGGGGILDVGCYAVSGARLIAGAAIGQPFANPDRVSGAGKVGTTEVDEWAAAVLHFPSGIIAQVATAVRAQLDNVLSVSGSEGSILMHNPWAADRKQAVVGRITLIRKGQPEEIEVAAAATSFALEADMVAEAIAAGRMEPHPTAMTWADTLGNLATLDAWRKEAGVVYEQEKPARRKTNISGRRVALPPPGRGNPMRYGEIPRVEKPVSKFVLGALVANGSFAKAQVLFDHWLECGGNAFDTSFHYGPTDRILGQWLASRGVRKEVVLVAKGAHTPNCNPEGLSRQLLQSLESLQTDHTDVYIMHRDNEEIPAGEFIDVLNEHVSAGRIRAIGASNWSLQRFAEANDYARKHGKLGLSILNNNLSLARMVQPVWAGCLHVSDKRSRAWLERNKVIQMAWSSQARGFFTDRAEEELGKPGTDPELRRCWISRDNLARRKRAILLARRKGVLPINIAAAYVIRQPFESYALIGPENLQEMESCLPGLTVRLTREELQYLWGR